MDEVSGLFGGEEASIADFSGSLDYIDSLGVDSPGRNANAVSNVLAVDELLPQDSVSTVDNRRFNPSVDFDPGALVPGADRLSVPDVPAEERERMRRIKINPFYRDDPEYWKLVRHHQDRLMEHHLSSLSFDDPLRVKICIERKKRREILASKGLLGKWRRPKYFTPFSRVKC